MNMKSVSGTDPIFTDNTQGPVEIPAGELLTGASKTDMTISKYNEKGLADHSFDILSLPTRKMGKATSIANLNEDLKVKTEDEISIKDLNISTQEKKLTDLFESFQADKTKIMQLNPEEVELIKKMADKAEFYFVNVLNANGKMDRISAALIDPEEKKLAKQENRYFFGPSANLAIKVGDLPKELQDHLNEAIDRHIQANLSSIVDASDPEGNEQNEDSEPTKRAGSQTISQRGHNPSDEKLEERQKKEHDKLSMAEKNAKEQQMTELYYESEHNIKEKAKKKDQEALDNRKQLDKIEEKMTAKKKELKEKAILNLSLVASTGESAMKQIFVMVKSVQNLHNHKFVNIHEKVKSMRVSVTKPFSSD